MYNTQNKAWYEETLYPAQEQGIEPELSLEERREKIKQAQIEEDVLDEQGREQLIEDDELDNWEAGFAQGASENGQLAKDALTGEALIDPAKIIEIVYDGHIYRFLSLAHAEKFRKKKKKENHQLE